MENKIVIDDGFKTYDIENQDGKLLGQFSFNPSDTNIIHRHAEVVKALEELEVEIPEGESETDTEEALAKIEKIIHEKLNYLLNADVAENFFSIMGALTPLANGQYFIESVIDAIGQAIQAETGTRMQKVNGKIKKHTAKYHR